MKRILSLLLALAMIFALAGCGRTAPAPAPAEAPAVEAAPAEEPAPVEEPAPIEAAEISVTDMIGREVTVTPGSYTRVVCIGAGALRMYSYVGDVALLCGVEDIDNPTLAERPKVFDSVARPYLLAYGESFAALPSCGVGGPQAQAPSNSSTDTERTSAILGKVSTEGRPYPHSQREMVLSMTKRESASSFWVIPLAFLSRAMILPTSLESISPPSVFYWNSTTPICFSLFYNDPMTFDNN